MEPRLLNRLRQIPNGFVFIQSQTGWDSVKVLGKHPSFDRLVDAIVAHRKGNPWVCHKHQLVTDRLAVAEEVDLYNAKICQAHGWTDFIVNTDASPPKSLPQLPEGGGAVAAVKRSTAGIKLVVDWLGSGLKPVPINIAERRAAICLKCPLNQESNFWQRIGAVAAQQVKKLLEVRNDLNLRLANEDKLFSCQACDCWINLKAFSNLDHIIEHTSEEVWQRLDPNCWMLSESGRTHKSSSQSVDSGKSGTSTKATTALAESESQSNSKA
jgi:hypothetical protein